MVHACAYNCFSNNYMQLDSYIGILIFSDPYAYYQQRNYVERSHHLCS